MINNLNLTTPRHNPNFEGRVETRTVLECICGLPFKVTAEKNFSRDCDIAEITGIAQKKIGTKNMPLETYSDFIETIGTRIMENYKEFKPVRTAFENMMIKSFDTKKFVTENQMEKFADKYIKKFGEEVDISLPDGEKSFIGKLFDMMY